MATFDEPVDFQAEVTFRGTVSPGWTRDQLVQDNLKPYTIPWTWWRVFDALQTNLPGTAATDDLALIGGTFATASPSIQAGDLKAAGATTRYARAQIPLPAEYVAGETVVLRFHAAVQTTIADASCVLDVECFKTDEEVSISADLYAGAALDINSTTFADKDFAVTPTVLVPGDLLDVRIAITCTDAATGTAVIPTIGAAKLLADVKG